MLRTERATADDANRRAERESIPRVERESVHQVNATTHPVHVGDLLTTSSLAGHAMKAVDPFRAFGAVIGKAIGRLESGIGLVPVLVALQ